MHRNISSIGVRRPSENTAVIIKSWVLIIWMPPWHTQQRKRIKFKCIAQKGVLWRLNRLRPIIQTLRRLSIDPKAHKPSEPWVQKAWAYMLRWGLRKATDRKDQNMCRERLIRRQTLLVKRMAKHEQALGLIDPKPAIAFGHKKPVPIAITKRIA
jgi:hypothetical protein